MDGEDNLTHDDQYADVEETINQGSLAGDVTAGDVAAVSLGAGLQTATNTGATPDVDQFVVEAEKQKGQADVLNLDQGKAAQIQASTEFAVYENIDPENPSTVPDKIWSKDENEDDLLALNPDLFDPESIPGKTVVTLGAYFPGYEPTQDALDKDPIPNPRDVERLTGITDPAEVDGILQYCQALSYHKRKL